MTSRVGLADRSYVLAAMTCFGVAALLVYAMVGGPHFSNIFDARLEWACLLLACGIVTMSAWWARYRGRLDFFEFPTWISFNLFGQVIAPYWLLAKDIYFYPSLRFDYEHWMLMAVLLFAVCLSAVWCGYILVWRHLRITAWPVRQLDLTRTIFVWTVLWGANSTVAFLGYNPQTWGGSGAGTWNNYMAFVGILLTAANSALMIFHFRHPSNLGWIWLIGTLGVSLVSGLAIGTRGAALVFVNVFMVAYYASRRYMWQWLVIGALALVVLVPAATTLRAIIPRFERVNTSERLEVVSQAISNTMHRPASELTQDVVELFQRRQGDLFLVTASVMRQHPAMRPFLGLQMLEALAQNVIPRVLWPSKPAGTNKLYYINTWYTDTIEETSFADIGLFADSYRTGGWLFSFVFFMFLGGFMAWVYWRGPATDHGEWTVLYIVLLGVFAYSAAILESVTFVLQRAIPVWIFIISALFPRTDDTTMQEQKDSYLSRRDLSTRFGPPRSVTNDQVSR